MADHDGDWRQRHERRAGNTRSAATPATGACTNYPGGPAESFSSGITVTDYRDICSACVWVVRPFRYGDDGTRVWDLKGRSGNCDIHSSKGRLVVVQDEDTDAA